jgi:hypothetical protein
MSPRMGVLPTQTCSPDERHDSGCKVVLALSPSLRSTLTNANQCVQLEQEVDDLPVTTLMVQVGRVLSVLLIFARPGQYAGLCTLLVGPNQRVQSRRERVDAQMFPCSIGSPTIGPTSIPRPVLPPERYLRTR